MRARKPLVPYLTARFFVSLFQGYAVATVFSTTTPASVLALNRSSPDAPSK